MKIGAKWALGLQSDPSASDLQASITLTDGLDILDIPATLTRPYPYELRNQLLSLTKDDLSDVTKLKALDNQVTQCFIDLANELMQQVDPNIKLEAVGLSGYGYVHDPETKQHFTFGDPQKIADALHLPVIHHFVKEDLNAGGVGSPLLTVFWDALCRDLPKPVVVVGLGGILRLNYMGVVGDIMGFDPGFGLSLLDRWIQRHTGEEMDYDGVYGARGKVDQRVLDALLKMPYQLQKPPKAVQFTTFPEVMTQIDGLSTADGAATLTYFIAHSIKNAVQFLPEHPVQWIFAGGGTKNPTLMLALSQLLENTHSAKDIFEKPENLDATGFAFLAIRHLMQLPISFPSTTGVYEAVSVGKVTMPSN